MKTYIRTIFMLGVIALLTASSTLAQENAGEIAIAESSQPTATVPSPSKEPVPPTPSPSKPDAVFLPTVGYGADVCGLGFGALDGSVTYAIAQNTTGRSSSSSKVLVIPNTEIKTEDLVEITQDLQVMSHIFHKIFTGPQLVEGLFMIYGDFFGRGSRATEAVYLQGYGALFLMEVNIPLSSPPKAKETEKDESTQKTDSVWNQAKHEIFHPSPYNKTRTTDPTERYDEKKVEELKTRLIKALKHAANMRNLEPDESIILTVIGEGGGYSGGVGSGVGGYGGYGSGYGGVGAYSGGYGGAGYGVGYGSSVDDGGINKRIGDFYVTTRSVPGGIGITGPTVLTIRAKKSDVDAFSKGELDYDKFREKVQILTYPSWGQQVGQEVHPPALNPEPAVR